MGATGGGVLEEGRRAFPLSPTCWHRRRVSHIGSGSKSAVGALSFSEIQVLL